MTLDELRGSKIIHSRRVILSSKKSNFVPVAAGRGMARLLSTHPSSSSSSLLLPTRAGYLNHKRSLYKNCGNRLFWIRATHDAQNLSSSGGSSEKPGGDELLRCISKTAEVSVLSIVATDVVQEAQRRHKAAPTAAAALGRALMGTLLLGALKDEAETVQVTFLGRGPLGQMTTIASGLGFVKGFVGDPLCNPPLKPNGKLDVGAAVGPGILTVVRNHRNWKQPYTGTVPIYSGEVAEDIAHYLADSEQINTAMGLGVTFGKDSVVKSARGYLVQVLPFCSEETLIKLEENVQRMLPLADISEDSDANSIVECLLHGIGIGDFSDPVVPHFGPCGVQELKPRMIQAVASLGPSDIQKLLKEQGSVEVKCEFCAEVVRFEENDLEHILHPAS